MKKLTDGKVTIKPITRKIVEDIKNNTQPPRYTHEFIIPTIPDFLIEVDIGPQFRQQYMGEFKEPRTFMGGETQWSNLHDAGCPRKCLNPKHTGFRGEVVDVTPIDTDPSPVVRCITQEDVDAKDDGGRKSGPSAGTVRKTPKKVR